MSLINTPRGGGALCFQQRKHFLFPRTSSLVRAGTVSIFQSSLDTLVESVLLPKGLRLAPHSACRTGLPRLLNYLPGKAEQRRGAKRHPLVSQWPVETPLLTPREALLSLRPDPDGLGLGSFL